MHFVEMSLDVYILMRHLLRTYIVEFIRLKTFEALRYHTLLIKTY